MVPPFDGAVLLKDASSTDAEPREAQLRVANYEALTNFREINHGIQHQSPADSGQSEFLLAA